MNGISEIKAANRYTDEQLEEVAQRTKESHEAKERMEKVLDRADDAAQGVNPFQKSTTFYHADGGTTHAL